jgi:hypothetical protein
MIRLQLLDMYDPNLGKTDLMISLKKKINKEIDRVVNKLCQELYNKYFSFIKNGTYSQHLIC